MNKIFLVLGILLAVGTVAIAYALFIPQETPPTNGNGKTWTCDTTMDCTWCNKECVNWKTFSLLSFATECTDRDPMSSMSCQCSAGYCNEAPFEYQSGLVTFCSEEDWYRFVNEFPGSASDMSRYLRDHCDGMIYWQDGCELEYRGLVYLESFTGNANFECVSNCYDANGRLLGGRVLYSILYSVLNGEFIGPICPETDWCLIDVGCYDYSETQTCCYNDGLVNPYQQTFSVFDVGPVRRWVP